jgi:hypothetical protein
MFAVFHMAGIVLDSYAILNMTVSIGAMNGASSFKTALLQTRHEPCYKQDMSRATNKT